MRMHYRISHSCFKFSCAGLKDDAAEIISTMLFIEVH